MDLLEQAKEIVRNYKGSLPEKLKIFYPEDYEVTSNDLAENLNYFIHTDYLTIEEGKLVPSKSKDLLGMGGYKKKLHLVKDEKDVTLGASKLKGLPHLPESIQWPEGHYFLAQFNLEELSKHDVNKLFPEKGMLYIFFNSEKEAKVIYYDGALDNLAIRNYPNDNMPNAKYYLKDFQEEVSLIKFTPYYIFYINEGDSYDYSVVAKLIPEDLQKQISTLLNCEMADSDYDTRILGKALYWQDEEDGFAFYKNTDEEFEEDEYNDDEGYLTHNPANNNYLLFQDSFADGNIHIWIGKEALKNKDFSKVSLTYSGT